MTESESEYHCKQAHHWKSEYRSFPFPLCSRTEVAEHTEPARLINKGKWLNLVKTDVRESTGSWVSSM